MRLLSFFVTALLLLAAGTDRVRCQEKPKLVPNATPMAISQSGQFTVYGGTPAHRGEFVGRCEALSRDVANVTGQPKSQWIHPCVIELTVAQSTQSVQRRATAGVFALDPRGYRLQLYLLLDDQFQLPEFHQEFIKLLLIERMLHPERPDAKIERLPGWILTGVTELVEYRRAGRPSDVFDALMDARQIPPVTEIIKTSVTDYPDSVSRGIFQACAAALVQALLDQASGPARFQALLEDLAYSPDPIEVLLRTHFPALEQSQEAVAKWWTLQLAAMSARSAFELLNVTETERILEQSLRIDLTVVTDEAVAKSTAPGRFLKLGKRSPGKAGAKTDYTAGPLTDFGLYLKDPRAPQALKECADRLAKLSARCFPLHRPVISEYGKAISRLLAGETAGVHEELEDLRKRREELVTLMGGVTDYMNWHVTTQVKEASDDFTGYAQALKSLESLEARKRQDPITNYLDAVEQELAP